MATMNSFQAAKSLTSRNILQVEYTMKIKDSRRWISTI